MEKKKKPVIEEAIVPINFKLAPLMTLRRHFHRLGNRMDRDLATEEHPVRKEQIREQRDFFKSIANYLDIADHIKMTQL